MVSIPHSRFPRLVEGIDLRGLPIGPREAFVLSRVDGSTSELDIAEAAGLDADAVTATLDQLVRLGAIRFDLRQAGESNRTPRPPARPSGASRLVPIIETVGATPQHPAAALYDPEDLAEAVDLDEPRKRTILETFHRLDSVTHYQLLHVDPIADKRAIKNAYYEIVNVFHPDRYFGKTLGSFKHKLERVFARLTEAHDVLTRAAPRAEYDAYLASRSKTREFDHRLSDASVESQIRAIKQQIEEEARAAERAQLSGPPSLAPGPTQSEGKVPVDRPSGQEASQAQSPSSRPLDSEARKRSLARKLGSRTLSGATHAPVSSIVPPSLRSEARERAAEALKRRYEQRLVQAREQRAERYLSSARAAISAKDAASAANALRIAASLVSGNAELSGRLEAAHAEAEALLSNHYLSQAQYEERDGRLAEAARSYARSAIGNPSARLFERAAHCGLMAASDLRLAGEHARRAVALAARDEEAQARVTLARIYVTAGMKQSALAEFERAATLAPKDDSIRDWIRRIKRGEA